MFKLAQLEFFVQWNYFKNQLFTVWCFLNSADFRGHFSIVEQLFSQNLELKELGNQAKFNLQKSVCDFEIPIKSYRKNLKSV